MSSMTRIQPARQPVRLGEALAHYPDLPSDALGKVRVRVLSGFGLNCEAEGAAAFEMLGVPATVLHAKTLLDNAAQVLQDTDVLVFSGGFSFGDHLTAGRVLAQRLRAHCQDALARYLDRGGLALGMCNGFQVMVKMGLLPGLGRGAGTLAGQQVSLVSNERLGYRNAWVSLGVDPKSACVFTKGMTRLDCPSRHGEGRLVLQDGLTTQTLLEQGCVPVRYLNDKGGVADQWPQNPNGSPAAIAGLCDPSGRAFGLMPHPEAFLYPENHPHWRRRLREGGSASQASTPGAGLEIFANALRAILSP